MDELEEEPKTPRKSNCLKRKRTATKPITPQKTSKGNKALRFFNGPVTHVENNVFNSYYSCTICKKELCGNNISNLASHLLNKHENIYEQNIGEIEDLIEVKRLKLLQNCVSIVALCGRPFASLLDYGFQQIIDNQLRQFAIAGIPLDLKQRNQPAVHAHLNESAQQVRDAIKNAINGNTVSIQLDIATRLGRSIFGINVQYISNKQLNIHNIGMIELDKAHTGSYLSKEYQQSLKKHSILKQQVVSISSDNGQNVQKLIRIEQEEARKDSPNMEQVVRRLDYTESQLPPRDTATIDEEIEAVLATTESTDDDNAIVGIFEECGIDLTETIQQQQEHETLLRETIAEISTEHGHNLFDLTGVNCAAHTLQLVVKDSLKALGKETSNIFDLSRRITKALKLTATKLIVEEAKLQMKVPSLDVETRWSSTYAMLKGLSELRDVIECIAKKATKKRYVEFPLFLEKWQVLKDLVRVLYIPYKATIELQRQDLTLSDTYGIWLEIKLRLQRIIDNRTSNTGLAVTMLDKFIGRYDKIYNNPAMKAAIFLDPRYRVGIMHDRLFVEEAKEFIIDMHRRLSYLRDIQNESDSRTDDNNLGDDCENFDLQLEMNRYWESQASNSNSNNQSDFDAALDAFDPPMMYLKDNLFDYWNSTFLSESCEIELHKIAMVIFAIPPTEVQTERNFSALKRILSDMRGNLSRETLQNILTINLNKDMYLEIMEKQVENIRKN